jgi:ABC-type branched-subunit amino acid transport system substrate-binding protein
MSRSWCSLTAIVVSIVMTLTESHAQEKNYGPGATDTTITIGNLMPYSGSASALSIMGRVLDAYFKKLNEEGGVNGRKIVFLSYDDAYNPSKAVEQARKLVENDDVLLLFSTVGTATNVAIQKYLNTKGVPHLFVANGAARFTDPAFPWTTTFYPSFAGEGRLYARFILDNHPQAKIGIITQKDDSGRDLVRGFREGLGQKADSMIVAERSIEGTETTPDSQIVYLKSSGADVLVSFVGSKLAVQSAKKVKELEWKPLYYLQLSAATQLASALEFADGMITANFLKLPTDTRWKDDPDVTGYLAFMNKYAPTMDKENLSSIRGYTAAQALVQVLAQCGDNLTRENVMKQSQNLKDFMPKMFLPGITLNTGPKDYSNVIRQEELSRYSLAEKSWLPISKVITLGGNATE